MQSTTWRPARVLVASDLSSVSDQALQYAAAVASHFNAPLYLTHVLTAEHSTDAEKESAKRRLSAILQSVQTSGLLCEILIEKGFLCQTIENLIRKHVIDLVIVGTSGHKNRTKEFAGSWAELIFRHVDCPVMTVGPNVKSGVLSAETFKNILFPTDFSRIGQHAMPYACSMAREYGATLTLLHVLDDVSNYSKQALAVLLETTNIRLLESAPAGTEQWCKLETAVQVGDSAQEILGVARSQKTDLIVMGAKSGRTLVNHLPEPTAYTVAAGAPCPVLTIRA